MVKRTRSVSAVNGNLASLVQLRDPVKHIKQECIPSTTAANIRELVWTISQATNEVPLQKAAKQTLDNFRELRVKCTPL